VLLRAIPHESGGMRKGNGMLAAELALVIAALFCGAALYISVAEQPARLKLDDRALLTEWKTAYRRGYAMQAPLAILSFTLGILAWYQTKELAFLVGALFMMANLPWTLLVIKPVNDPLMRTALEDAGSVSRALILKWNALHSVRTLLAGAAVISFLQGLSRK
jgi:Domain of unknown function (DUF1772)